MNLLWKVLTAPFRPISQPKPDRQMFSVRPPTGLRMKDWRANPDAVKSASLILSDPTCQAMVDILKTENPCNIVLLGRFTLEERGIQQARVEGYCMALNNLELLGRFETTPDSLHEEFSDPEDRQPVKYVPRPITPFKNVAPGEPGMMPPPEPPGQQ